MSLFTKRRKFAREEKQERQERLRKGYKQIEKSMNKMLAVSKAMFAGHPEFETLNEEERASLFRKYLDKYELENKSVLCSEEDG